MRYWQWKSARVVYPGPSPGSRCLPCDSRGEERGEGATTCRYKPDWLEPLENRYVVIHPGSVRRCWCFALRQLEQAAVLWLTCRCGKVQVVAPWWWRCQLPALLLCELDYHRGSVSPTDSVQIRPFLARGQSRRHSLLIGQWECVSAFIASVWVVWKWKRENNSAEGRQ